MHANRIHILHASGEQCARGPPTYVAVVAVAVVSYVWLYNDVLEFLARFNRWPGDVDIEHYCIRSRATCVLVVCIVKSPPPPVCHT